VIEDGPTITHGEMPYGVGWIATQKYNAAELVDPRPYAKGSIKATYRKYPHIEKVLPAVGYSNTQRKELEETINASPCEAVVVGTPIDLGSILRLNKPTVRVRYELQEVGSPNLEEVLSEHGF
jgi:predicted GTPase